MFLDSASPGTRSRSSICFSHCGFRRALEPIGGRCVFTSEIDVDAQETYALNFGGESLFGDITAVPTEDFPQHDVLTAGFPCQPFARRVERLGFEDARGELFHEIPRMLRAKRPACFLLENVWNMQFLGEGQWDKDQDKWVYGDVFKTIVACLENVGYVVRTKTMSAQDWVPQKQIGISSDVVSNRFNRNHVH